MAHHGLHLACHLALCAHAAQQHPDGGHAAPGHQGAHQPAQRGAPVVKAHQHHGVKHQHQVSHGDEPVRLEEALVRKAPHQRQHHKQHGGIKGPFAQSLGRFAQAAQPGLQSLQLGAGPALGPLQQACTHQPFGRFGQQPVTHRQHQPGNAQPLVQAVHLVQAAQPGLQAHRAHGQQHGQAHHTHAQHAAVLDQQIAPGKKALEGGQAGGIDEQPKSRKAEQAEPVKAVNAAHGRQQSGVLASS